MADITVAQALMLVLTPIGAFASALASLFVKRHFQFLDKLEVRLEASSKLDAEIAQELRLARESREHEGKRIDALERAIEDRRIEDLGSRIDALVGGQPPDDTLPPTTAPNRRPRRPPLPSTPEAPARPPLRSSSDR